MGSLVRSEYGGAWKSKRRANSILISLLSVMYVLRPIKVVAYALLSNPSLFVNISVDSSRGSLLELRLINRVTAYSSFTKRECEER